jgi:hypothetical protein
MAGDASRPFELRVTPFESAPARRDVARRLVTRFPGEEPVALSRRLATVGFVGRLALGEGEAPALLRELYAAGAPPAAVVLVPAELGAAGRRAEEAADGDTLELFARRDGAFVPTWNWAAFVLWPLWYLRKGLWAKGLVILVATLYPFWSLPVSVLVALALFLYCGAVGNWDYYLLRVKRTQWW